MYTLSIIYISIDAVLLTCFYHCLALIVYIVVMKSEKGIIVKEYLLNECELKAYDALLIQCAQ